MSRTSRGMRGRGWSPRRPRSGWQARAASTKVRITPFRTTKQACGVEGDACLLHRRQKGAQRDPAAPERTAGVVRRPRSRDNERRESPLRRVAGGGCPRAGREKIEVAGRVRGVNDGNRASADQEDDGASCQLAIDASEELEECRGFKLGRHAVRRGPGKNPLPCS